MGRRGESNLVTGLVEEKKRITTIGRVVAFTFFKGQFIIGLTLDGTMEIHFSTCDTRRIYNTLLLQEAGLLKIGNFFFLFLFLSILFHLPPFVVTIFFSFTSIQSLVNDLIVTRYPLFLSFLPSFFPPPPLLFFSELRAPRRKGTDLARINQSYDARCF